MNNGNLVVRINIARQRMWTAIAFAIAFFILSVVGWCRPENKCPVLSECQSAAIEEMCSN